MSNSLTSYPSDVSDDEWAFVAPYLTLMREDAPQRDHPLRERFNGLRWIVRAGAPWRRLPTTDEPAAVARGRRAAPTLAGGGLLRAPGARPARPDPPGRGPRSSAIAGQCRRRRSAALGPPTTG